MDKYFHSFRDMIALRGLTDHTLKSYCTYIQAYMQYLTEILHKMPEDVSWQELRDFVRWLQKSRNLSERTINAAIAQLRFFTIYVLHQPWDQTQLPSRKFDAYLPYVPSKDETLHFISSMPDLKAKTMLAVLYSSGLRVGELCRLRCEDIDRKQMRIHITHSKSRQDRYAILSKHALDLLTRYWHVCGKPREFLFPSQRNQNLPIAPSFLAKHIRAHEERLGLPRRLTSHSFRHAFGTHLYENGADLLTIKALMGHKSLQSTALYVHLAQVGLRHAVSPFDLPAGGTCHD